MLPRRFLQKSATVLVTSRRRSYAYLHRATSSQSFLRFINYLVIFSSYLGSPCRLLSFFLSRDQFQGYYRRTAFWLFLILLSNLWFVSGVSFSPLQEGLVLTAMWSVSNLKDRRRLVLYIRFLALEVLLCVASRIWTAEKICEFPGLSYRLVAHPLPALPADSSSLSGSIKYDLPDVGVELKEPEEDEDFHSPTALVSVNNHLSVFNVSSYSCCLFSWLIWVCESLFYFFM